MKAEFGELQGQVKAMLEAGVPRQEVVTHIAKSGWGVKEFSAVNKSGRYTGPVSSFVQGATFGAGDEMKGAVQGGLRSLRGEEFGPAYDEELEAARAVQDNFARENPVTDFALQAAGGAATTSLLPMSRAATLGQAARRGAVAGAAGGAAYGFNSGEGLADRVENAMAGGGMGGLLGAALPVALRAGNTLYQGIRAALPGGAERGASYAVGRALQRDATDPRALADQLDEAAALGKPATMADVGGANVKRLAEVAAQSPGAGSQQAKVFLEGRAKGQLARLANDLKQATGTYKAASEAIEETLEARSQAAAPLYKAAMEFPAEQYPEIVEAFQGALKTPYGRSAMARASRDLLTEYRGGIDSVPFMVRIDAWKKAIDDLAGQAQRSGARNQGRVIQGLRDSVIGTVDDVQKRAGQPVYLEARNAWSGPSQFLDALDVGRKIEKMSPDEVAAFFRSASEANKDAFRVGAVNALQVKMGQNAAEMPDLTRVMKSPNMADKIRAMIPDEALAETYGRRLGIEREMASTGNQALRNSATAARLAGMEDNKDVGILMEALRDLMTGRIGGLLQKVVFGVPGRIRERALPARNAEIARRLFETDPRLQRDILTDIGMRGIPSAAPVRPSVVTGTAASQLMTDPAEPELTGF